MQAPAPTNPAPPRRPASTLLIVAVGTLMTMILVCGGGAAALLYLGRNPNEVKGDEVAVVSELFAKIKPSVRYFNSSKYIDDLAAGEICIAMGYNGDVIQARDRAAEAKNGVEIAYAIPKEGALRWMDSAAIPADAPHPDNAHAFVDFILRPDVIAPITNYVAYANANAKEEELGLAHSPKCNGHHW